MNAHAIFQMPDAEAWRRQLLEVGDGLQGQCYELHARPSPERCERLLINLEGAARAIRAFRERLVLEGDGDGR